MRKFLILIAVSFLLTSNTYGQTQQDNIDAYNKVKKWAVVKLTIAYMEDCKKSDQIEIDTYNDLKQEYDIYIENVDLNDFSEKLSKGWGKTREGVFNNYKEELIDNEGGINFKNIKFVPVGSSNIERVKVSELINEKYSSLLPKIEQKVETGLKEVAINLTVSDTNISKVVKEESNWGNVLLYGLLILSVLFNIFLIMKTKLFKGIKKANNFNNGKVRNLEDLGKLNLSLQSKIQTLTKEIESLKKENLDFKSKLDASVDTQIEKPIEDQKAITQEFKIQNSQKSTKRIIYFPSPFENKKFANEDMSETEKPTSLYVAEIDKNSNKGIISLLETADLTRALNSPNTFLETACDYENAYNPSAKGVKVIKDGEVMLSGQDWLVIKKIKIKFI